MQGRRVLNNNNRDIGTLDLRLGLRLRSLSGAIRLDSLNEQPCSLNRDLLVFDWIKDLVFLILFVKF
jgi:hypothetical protein